MKNVIRILVVLFLVVFLGGCEEVVPKTEYGFKEEAVIDDLRIEMIDANYLENNILEVIFEITNERKNTITLQADNNFKLYDINKVQIPNKYTSNNSIIKSNETVKYTLQYETKKELYEILFYSGIVENNIKFNLTSLDIE